MRLSRTKLLTLVVLAAALIGTAQAGVIITNTFDGGQVPPPGGSGPNGPAVPTAANGVHALGVLFTFTQGGLASTTATYGDTIGAAVDQLAPLTDPLLDGPADGVLTLSFDTPTTFLSFDIAFISSANLGGFVTIGGGSSKAFTTTGNSGLMGLFSVGSFSWTPASPFTQATITFDSAAAGTQFAIDNVSYEDPPLAPSVPEPASLALFGSGMLTLGLIARKRTRLR